MRRPTLSLLAVVLSTACGPQYDPQEQQQLNDELRQITLQDALANRSRYEPLCDGQGYPLVGNVNAKTASAAHTFCQAAQGPGR